MNLSQIIICSDFDGTLTGNPPDGKPFVTTPMGKICRENIDAIKHLTSRGGKFVIVSGRSALMMQYIYDYIPADDLMAGTNAAMIYRRSDRKTVALHPMRMTPAEFAKRISSRADDLPVMHITDCSGVAHGFMPGEGDLSRFLSAFPTALKIIFDEHDPKKMAALESFLRSAVGDKCEVAKSASFLIECFDKGGGKGDMVRYLKSSFPEKTIVALGDYENDLDMLTEADMAFCPENASPKVKSVCLATLRASGDGFIADVTERLERL